MEQDFTQKIELIKSKVNIVDVIGKYLKLNKKGKNYWVVCPFHEDSNPSMSISPEKQIYKCFSCNAAGNVFMFLQKYKNIDFLTSLQEAAKIANIDLKSINIDFNHKKNIKHPFILINEITLNFYQYQLTTELGKEAIQYLKSRNITKDQIDYFKIGFAPKNNQLLDYLLMQGYEKQELIDAGIAKLSENNEIKDMFSNRIVFPIFNLQNECIGFSARNFLTTKNNNFKYINSPETEVFKKSELLYNLNNVINSNQKFLYLVEGYMDVIALNSKKINNVIAIMGTNLTQKHITILKKINKEIKILLDGDNPGKLAAYKIATNCLLNDFTVKIINNTTNLDPDELINKNTKEFNKIINDEIHPLQFAIDLFKKNYDFTKDSFQIEYFIKDLKPMWNAINNPIDHSFYLNEISKITNIEKNEIEIFLKTKTINQEKSNNSKKYQKISYKQKIILLQKELIYLLLTSRETYNFFESKKFIFCNQKLMNLYFLITQKYSEDKKLKSIDYIKLQEELQGNDIFIFLTEIIEENKNKKNEITTNNLEEYLKINNQYSIEVKIELLKESLNYEEKIEEKIKILQKISQLKKQKNY